MGTGFTPAIASALGLGERRTGSASDTVLGWLADRDALLVLDNCEHLLDGVLVLLEALVVGCPRLVVWQPAGRGYSFPTHGCSWCRGWSGLDVPRQGGVIAPSIS